MIKKLLLFFICLTAIWIFFHMLHPAVKPLASGDPSPTAFMRHRADEARSQGRSFTIRHQWVSLKHISPYLVQAVLIAEDDKFFSHHGFDFDMIKQAIRKNLRHGGIKFGASTITQQLAKNLFLSPQRSFYRKFQEAVITLRLELNLAKERILELYLNLVELGPGVFGVQAAALAYFGIPAASLSPRQAASLAAILPSPRRYSAVNPSPHVRQRIDELLGIMRKRGLGKVHR